MNRDVSLCFVCPVMGLCSQVQLTPVGAVGAAFPCSLASTAVGRRASSLVSVTCPIIHGASEAFSVRVSLSSAPNPTRPSSRCHGYLLLVAVLGLDYQRYSLIPSVVMPCFYLSLPAPTVPPYCCMLPFWNRPRCSFHLGWNPCRFSSAHK